MADMGWGTKRSCPSCGGRFYDLGNNPAECPKCHYRYDPTVVVRSRRGRGAKKAAAEKAAAVLEAKRSADARKKIKAEPDLDDFEPVEGLEDIEEIDEIEDLEEIAEIDDIEEDTSAEDETDEESLLEDLDPQDSVIVDTIEEVEEVEEEEDAPAPKPKKKKKN